MPNLQMIRYGSYGILTQEAKLLLTLKKSGPYKGLWGLPGGAIEFGESPEATLKRELVEEVALMADRLELLNIASSVGKYETKGGEYFFHHIGIIYRVLEFQTIFDLIPEEEARWIRLEEIQPMELTPFAKHVFNGSSF
jgi:8-oxo-dGTP diphosphatase